MAKSDKPEDWRPPWLKLPLEVRALAQWMQMPSAAGQHWPNGAGRPVMVIPGFGQSDSSTAALRNILKQQHFAASGWGLGRNTGIKPGMTAKLLQKIEALHQETQHSVSLVGWSLGGVFARELARKQPNHVHRVISLGSPLAGGQTTTLQTLLGIINPKSGKSAHDPMRYTPPPVPCTAIYTRSDGIVNWRASLEPRFTHTENIEVHGSHLGLGFNPAVWHAICHRLSPHTEQLPYNGENA